MSYSDYYPMSYLDVTMHKLMLQDAVRTDAYHKALRLSVKAGDQVLDFGCGTGILSIFASRFGARQVHAVDRSIFVQVARDIAKHNGVDNISFYYNDHASLKLDTKVDMIVSEWMGHFLFYETMLGPLLEVRDKFLRDGGVMIPGEVTLHCGLICDKSIYEDLSFLRTRPYDVGFFPVADVPLCQTDLNTLLPNQILKSTVNLGTLDLTTITSPPKVLTGVVKPNKKAKVYGLCGWFSTDLIDGVRFGTGPGDLPTHWDQIIFPLTEPFKVSPAREVTVKIAPLVSEGDAEQRWEWSISDAKKCLKNNDYEHRDQIDPFPEDGLLRDRQ